jgi:uncharacterized protein YcfJ
MIMLMRKRNMLLSVVLLLAAGCATVPAGPTVVVMPAPGKPFDLFQAEDARCRQWAGQQIGSSPQDTVNQNTAAGAVVGGIVGAGIGAMLGNGSGGSAAFGAVTGSIIGSSEGASSGQYYGYQAQRRYDIAYQQCMYANGNTVPGVRRHYDGPRTPPPPPGP